MHENHEILERIAGLFKEPINGDEITESVRTILESVGEDPKREGHARVVLRPPFKGRGAVSGALLMRP